MSRGSLGKQRAVPRYILPGLLVLFALGALFIFDVFKGKSSIKKPPHVLILLLDTLRADHLGAYSYPRDTSPHLDAFAASHIIFENAITSAPWTPPAVSSLLTGLYPSSHRMMPPNERELARGKAVQLNGALTTIPEFLHENGYRTAGISSNPWITKEFNFTQGFDEFYYLARETASKITENGIELLEKYLSSDNKKEDAQLFLYLHYLDPHDPYTPPAPYDEMFVGAESLEPFSYDERMQKFLGLYDGEIRYLDHYLGELFQYLKKKNLYEDMLIIIAGDHGEQFMERGDHRHGYQLYDEEVHVPLLVKFPRGEGDGRRVKAPVSLVDIFPTVADFVALEKQKPRVHGLSLRDVEALQNRPGVFSEIRRKYDQRSFVDQENYKILFSVPFNKENGWEESEALWRQGGDLIAIFNRIQDKHELSPVNEPARERALRKQFLEAERLAQSLRVIGDGDDVSMSNETLKQLKSLGYIE